MRGVRSRSTPSEGDLRQLIDELEWRYVEDELPEHTGEYQVSTSGSGDLTVGIRAPFVSDDTYDASVRRFEDPYVYAWRPRPKPAKERS